ncbi:MAG: bifunctional diaminohydroxyphosphoribosylaminopyrimidine deaminase/5-amino-6-(5-phosphoribosylamino)uracil reductase RibD [Spirochaetales bacterium]|nr:bifunctional diaminohydroxyphosphoribosylaminopyrimidine deaminase/5-amino-6-(5-phosphoribosylamino)uracil reductase RibD [Spirochaetales bacterium]
MHTDEFYMDRALTLARRGEGKVLPNPMVGAVVVRDGRIIGEGWHARYGGIHAEQAALENCKEDPAGAELYVTLEPCCHRGKGKHNPPCTDLIQAARISRVVIARLDPNPPVAGQAVTLLRQKGLSVETGIRERESASLNRVYESLITTNRPFVHLKAALTLDGFLADSQGKSQWISGPESRSKVMEFRSTCDAILVGRGTLSADLPSLTIRDSQGQPVSKEQPARIFLSTRGQVPENWDKAGGEVHIYHDRDLTPSQGPYHFHGVSLKEGQPDLEEVLIDLRQRGIDQLFVEGGSRVFGSFLASGLWDRLSLFLAPSLLGKGIPFSEGFQISDLDNKLNLNDCRYEVMGKDILVDAYRKELLCSQD